MNIYVGNLSYNISNDLLKKTFEEFGEVESAKVVMDQATGRSKGFGFIVMPNDQEAQRAIAELNGKELEGRQLTVNEARPFERSNTGGSFGGNRGGGDRGGFNRDRGGDRGDFGGGSKRSRY